MEWLNLHTSTLDSPEFIGADPNQRATWLCLLRYCVGQENGGTIEGGFEWSDRKLQQLIRITRAELDDRCQLWRRSAGDSIEVNFYPTAKEKQVRANRVNAVAGAAARWDKREADATCHEVGNAVGTFFADAEVKKKKADPAAPVIPLNLDTPAFAAAWADWAKHRKEKRAALTPSTVKQQLTKLANWGHDMAIDSLRESIAQGWTGIFEPRAVGGAAGKPRPAGTSAEMVKILGYQDGM